MRYSEGVKVDTVDAGLVKFVSGVHEKFLDAARHFGQASGCGEEPAVSKLTLLYVVRVDSIGAKECVGTGTRCT